MILMIILLSVQIKIKTKCYPEIRSFDHLKHGILMRIYINMKNDICWKNCYKVNSTREQQTVINITYKNLDFPKLSLMFIFCVYLKMFSKYARIVHSIFQKCRFIQHRTLIVPSYHARFSFKALSLVHLHVVQDVQLVLKYCTNFLIKINSVILYTSICPRADQGFSNNTLILCYHVICSLGSYVQMIYSQGGTKR